MTNLGSSSVSVFRNTGTGVGVISYADKVDFTTGTTPSSVAIGDLDGDGQADLAVTGENTAFVSVFKNTSTGAGVISYDTKADFAAGVRPISVAIGDLDGDGRVDLAVANSTSNNVSVLRNNSTATGVISYDTKADFDTGDNPQSVAIGDLDGDGRADLAVANSTSNNVSVFRNTSTGVGVISYDTKVDFDTGENPSLVAIGDLNGDGRVDLAVANRTSNNVSVLRNNSTGVGAISYDTKVDFVAGTFPSSVAIGDLDGDGKVDLAVANASDSNTVSVFRNTRSETSITAFSFAAQAGASATLDPVSQTIVIEVAYGTDVSALVADFTLSAGATATIGATSQQSGVTANDFSSAVTYTVTAEDGTTTQPWTVNVTTAPNTETAITVFSFAEQTGPATIDPVTARVDIEVAYGTDVSTLVAGFTLSAGATARVGTVSQQSGITANDFSSAVTYTVTAEDGTTTQPWTVSVTTAPVLSVTNAAHNFMGSPYPNPSDGTFVLPVDIAADSDIDILIRDLSGRLVLTKVVGGLKKGSHVLAIDLRFENGEATPSGTYFIEMNITTRKGEPLVFRKRVLYTK